MSDNIFNFSDFNDIFGCLFNNNASQIADLKAELDKLYWEDKAHYIYRLEKIKKTYRVFRDNKGNHKITKR